MHDFTSSSWTEDDSQDKRERVERLTDAELMRELESCAWMCAISASGRRPRESYRIQRGIVRLEICRRGVLLADFMIEGPQRV
jgi:hypothetical protein